MNRVVAILVVSLLGCSAEAGSKQLGSEPAPSSPAAPAPGTDAPTKPPADTDPTSVPSPSPPATQLQAYVFDCGALDTPDLDRFADDGSLAGTSDVLGNMCVLVRHPEGDLLWDAGLPDSVAQHPEGEAWAGFQITLKASLRNQLESIGVPPTSIEFFSASHSHGDHIGNVDLVSTATWIVDPNEETQSFRPAPADGSEKKTIEFSGKHDVFGDGTVVIVSTPGHTPGHASLLVDLPNAGPHLFTGDLYILPVSRERRLVPRNNTSHEQTLLSMDAFEKLADETGARVVIQHNPEDLAAMPQPPAFLD